MSAPKVAAPAGSRFRKKARKYRVENTSRRKPGSTKATDASGSSPRVCTVFSQERRNTSDDKNGYRKKQQGHAAWAVRLEEHLT